MHQILTPYLNKPFAFDKDRYKIEQLGEVFYITRFVSFRDGYQYYATIYFANNNHFGYWLHVFGRKVTGVLFYNRLQFISLSDK